MLEESFWLDVQLNVDASAGAFGDLAFRWLDEMSAELVPEARSEVAGLPAVIAGGRTAVGPSGEPGTLSGEVETWEHGDQRASAVRNASAAGIDWLRGELVGRAPRQAQLYLRRLDGRGHRSGWLVSLKVQHLPKSPDWLRLEAQLPESEFLDPQRGAHLQQRYLKALWRFADQLNPGFGQVDYTFEGETTFEFCLRSRERPRDWWDHKYSVSHSRSFLRGYSWLTIVPQELVEPLGGVKGLTDTGAFAQVRPLARGGLWLLATEDYRQFNDEALQRVFRAVAPVLRPGMPTDYPRMHGKSPHRLVFQDAAEIADG